MQLSTTSRPSTSAEQAARLLRHATHLLLDLDGTLIRQHEVMRGAADLLARFKHRFALVSNNSTHTATSLATRLKRMGLAVPPERIVLAGEEAVRHVRHRFPHARVMLMSSQAIRHFAVTQGCTLVQHDPDVVLLALDRNFTYKRLCAIVQALRHGAALVVSNEDLTHPGPDGYVVPETGALMAAVLAASGATAPHIVGKPQPLLFSEGLKRLGSALETTLVIGDNPRTDGDGALRFGLPFVQIGQGAQACAATPADLLAWLDAPERVAV